MSGQQVEELATRQAEQRCPLSLRDPAFLKPAQNGRFPKFLWKLFRPEIDCPHGFFRKLDCDLPRHALRLPIGNARSNE